MRRKDDILSRQNPILKTVFCLCLVLISSIVSFDKFLIIFVFTFLYLFLSPIIYLSWLKVIIKILPFFISLFLFGIIFGVPFTDQCYLSLRLIHFLLISAYLVKTSSLDSLSSGYKKQSTKLWFKFEFLLTAIVHFIPILIDKFNDNRKKHGNLVDIIVSSMIDCIKEIHNVEEAVFDEVDINSKKREVSLAADIYLSLLIVIPVIFIIGFN